MMIKSILIGAMVACLASAPITLPMAAGIPVALAIGPTVISYDRETRLNLDLDIACFSSECPVIELRYGPSGAESLRIGF